MAINMIQVIKFGTESYVYEADYGNRDRLIVNGRRDWPKAVGDANFIVVRGNVKTLERFVDDRHVTVKYALRPDLDCTLKPTWVVPEEYATLPETDRMLYSAVTERRKQKSEPIAFTVIDGKAAPRTMIHGIQPKLPDRINTLPWFWWTLPCLAGRDYVFAQMTDRVKALDPNHFAVTVYTNISHLRVTTRTLTIGGAEYRPTKDLVHLDKDRTSIPAFEGVNLDDVIVKVAAWCDEKMAPVRAVLALTSCPYCQQKLPKAVKPMLRGRDPRYRSGAHDIG